MSKSTCSLVFVPESLTAFRKSEIEPLVIALLRNSEILPLNALENLQKACEGELEIFRGNDGNVIITLPFNGSITPRQFQGLLARHCEVQTVSTAVSPNQLEEVAEIELRSSLHTSS